MVTDNTFDASQPVQTDKQKNFEQEKQELVRLHLKYETYNDQFDVLLGDFVDIQEVGRKIDDVAVKETFDKYADVVRTSMDEFFDLEVVDEITTDTKITVMQNDLIQKVSELTWEMAHLVNVKFTDDKSDDEKKIDGNDDVTAPQSVDNEPLNEKNVENRQEELNDLTIEELLVKYDTLVAHVISDYKEDEAINEFITLVTKRMNRGVVNMKDPKKRNQLVSELQKYVVAVIPQIEERLHSADINKELKSLNVDDVAYRVFIEEDKIEYAANNEILAMITSRDGFIKKEKAKLNTIRDVQQKKIAIETLQKNIIEAIDAINTKIAQESFKILTKEFGQIGTIYVDDNEKNIKVISYDVEDDVQIKFEDEDGSQSVNIEEFRDLIKDMKRQDVVEREKSKEINKFYDKVMTNASNNYADESEQIKSLIENIRTDVRNKVKELKNANSAKERYEKQVELVAIKLVAAQGLQDILDGENFRHKQNQDTLTDDEEIVVTSENDENFDAEGDKIAADKKEATKKTKDYEKMTDEENVEFDEWKKALDSKFDDDGKPETEQNEIEVMQPVLEGIESLGNEQQKEDLESSYYDMLEIFKKNNAFKQEIDEETAIKLYKELRQGLQENMGLIPTEELHILINLLEQNFGEGVSILEQIDIKESLSNTSEDRNEAIDTIDILEQNFGKGIAAGIIEQAKLFYENLKIEDELWEGLDEIELEEELEIYTREIIKEIIANVDAEYAEQNLTDQDVLNIYKKVVF